MKINKMDIILNIYSLIYYISDDWDNKDQIEKNLIKIDNLNRKFYL